MNVRIWITKEGGMKMNVKKLFRKGTLFGWALFLVPLVVFLNPPAVNAEEWFRAYVTTPSGDGLYGVRIDVVRLVYSTCGFWGCDWQYDKADITFSKTTDTNGRVLFYRSSFGISSSADVNKFHARVQLNLDGFDTNHNYGAAGEYFVHWDWGLGKGGPKEVEFTLVPRSSVKAYRYQIILLHGMGDDGGPAVGGWDGDLARVAKQLDDMLIDRSNLPLYDLEVYTPLLGYNPSIGKYGEWRTDSSHWLGEARDFIEDTFDDEDQRHIVVAGHSAGGRVAVRLVSSGADYDPRGKIKGAFALNSPQHPLPGTYLDDWCWMDNWDALCDEIFDEGVHTLSLGEWRSMNYSKAHLFSLHSAEDNENGAACDDWILDPYSDLRDDKRVPLISMDHNDQDESFHYGTHYAGGLGYMDKENFCHSDMANSGASDEGEFTSKVIATSILQMLLKYDIGAGKSRPKYWSYSFDGYRERLGSSIVDDAYTARVLPFVHTFSISDSDSGYDRGTDPYGEWKYYLEASLEPRETDTSGLSVSGADGYRRRLQVEWSGPAAMGEVRDFGVRLRDTFGIESSKHLRLVYRPQSRIRVQMLDLLDAVKQMISGEAVSPASGGGAEDIEVE